MSIKDFDFFILNDSYGNMDTKCTWNMNSTKS